MRLVAALLIVIFGIEACSTVTPPAGTYVPALPSFALAGSVETIEDFAIAPQGGLGGVPAAPLFELPSIPTTQGTLGLTVWGTKDVNGNITSVSQAEVLGLGTGQSTVHIFFNAASLPVLFLDDTSGYSIAVTNESAASPTITLCDPNGSADAYTTLSGSGSSIQASAVSSGGSCATTAVFGKTRRPLSENEPLTNVSNLPNIATLITAGSYVAGMAFAIGAILKFKAHKDNPTQAPIATPIALLFVAVALIFAPSLFQSSGATLFDSDTLASVDGVTPFMLLSP